MALIVVHDVTRTRDRIINTDTVFNCVECPEGLRVMYVSGPGRDSCVIAGSLEEFAKAAGAVTMGARGRLPT